MSTLSFLQKQKLESILWMSSWYVADFSNRTFSDCIRDVVWIDIYNDKYSTRWDSKANRLRVFWDLESDISVWKVLQAFADYLENSTIRELSNKLLWISEKLIEDSIDSIPLPKINISSLWLPQTFEEVIKQRIHDIEICLKNWAYLSVILLSWSTLEWLLFYKVSNNPKLSNTATSAPTDKTWKVKIFNEWSLSDMISVLHELQVLDKNVYKFSHALREFRNYIHPFQQAHEGFNPDKHTAEISYKILLLAIDKLSK